MKAVLFACADDAGRSQTAAACFDGLENPELTRAVSAGTSPRQHVRPEVPAGMGEVGIDRFHAGRQRLAPELAVTAQQQQPMGRGDELPVVPGGRRDDWPLEDPEAKPIVRAGEILADVETHVPELIANEDRRGPAMTATSLRASMAFLLCLAGSSAWAAPTRPAFNATLAGTIKTLLPASSAPVEDRKIELEKLAAYVDEQRAAKRPVNLLFICTHNSRRSHIAQLWASVAAAYYGVDGIHTFSGGTEVSAFNPRAVAAMQRAGFRIEGGDGANPHYKVTFASGQTPMDVFSKKYSDATNPQSQFAAVMTCAQADKSCPLVAGASLRVPLHYEDPKSADGTPDEASTYDARVRQIGSEMLYLFSRVRR